MKIYVGNLSFDVTADELRTEFTAFGKVDSVDVIMDKFSGRSKGFAFVEMPAISEGQAAINSLNGKVLKERTMNVSAARPREERKDSYRGGGGGGGRGGYDRGSRRY